MGAWLTRRKALLLDIDNTLYDWVAFFGPAFRGMCQTLSEMTGIPTETLWSEFKAVFARHGTVEYSFALQELPSIINLHPQATAAELVATYRPAIEVFQHRRRLYLHLYPGVREGMTLLHEAGYEIFAVTDSRRFQAEYRVRQIGLDRLLDGLCCVPDHPVPDEGTIAAIRRHQSDQYTSCIKNVIQLPAGLRKPSPSVLDFVVAALGVDFRSCLYAGDSLTKDVVMSQQAGIYDCWAEYGTKVSPLDFGTLVRITDWPTRAVKDALTPSPKRLRIQPSFSAQSFDAIVTLALMRPEERPLQQRPVKIPRQPSLLDGPTFW